MTTPAKHTRRRPTPTLRDRLDEYLVMRRALGFQLNDVERQVGLFCTWLEARGQTQTFTIDEAVAWARLNPDAHPSWWSTRLSLVRRFAGYLNANDVDVPVIPSGLLPARKPRAVPFIYSQDDLDALLAACDTVFSDERIAATLRTAIGLLAATGLRIGEALKLRVGDIDHVNDLLVIKAAKSAERLVPIHPTTTAALMDYIALPARAATHPDPRRSGLRDRQRDRVRLRDLPVHVPTSPRSSRTDTARQSTSPPARPETHLRHRAHDRGLRP